MYPRLDLNITLLYADYFLRKCTFLSDPVPIVPLSLLLWFLSFLFFIPRVLNSQAIDVKVVTNCNNDVDLEEKLAMVSKDCAEDSFVESKPELSGQKGCTHNKTSVYPNSRSKHHEHVGNLVAPITQCTRPTEPGLLLQERSQAIKNSICKGQY